MKDELIKETTLSIQIKTSLFRSGDRFRACTFLFGRQIDGFGINEKEACDDLGQMVSNNIQAEFTRRRKNKAAR